MFVSKYTAIVAQLSIVSYEEINVCLYFSLLFCYHIWNPSVGYLCNHADFRERTCLASKLGCIREHHCFYNFKLSR